MPGANRDLLVLTDAGQLSPAALERELLFLDSVLFHVENWEAFSIANEVIDINRRKIVRKTFLIQKILSERKVKSFVFVSNKN
ncbi:hypothetical protein GWC95_18610 [Sediminibacterium roseum]|uniref:Uncharacterized protein n=1 Tax=Sediminibacterium roseum TaxID=1978412 RepID=A0ABX0A0W8_9BACT|nr:hypothetical protein [Sediminibacterium roseum]NCI51943.1 hypothetical protein [Sediminibacterium roseum]